MYTITCSPNEKFLRDIFLLMAMARGTKGDAQMMKVSGELPSTLRSLGFVKKPTSRRGDGPILDTIQWSIRILRATDHEPALVYETDGYVHGPNCSRLQKELEQMDWTLVQESAANVVDDGVELVKDAISNGDDFLLALSMAVGIHSHNVGITSAEIEDMLVRREPHFTEVARQAINFVEDRIWNG
jgi:hypothetical protein